MIILLGFQIGYEVNIFQMDYMKCVNSFSPDTSDFLFVFFLMLCFSVPSAHEGHLFLHLCLFKVWTNVRDDADVAF